MSRFFTLLVASVLALSSITRASDDVWPLTLMQRAQQGDASAQYKMAIRCLMSKTSDSSIREAEQWLSKAAEQGVSDAQLVKAICVAMQGKDGWSFAPLLLLAEEGNTEARMLMGMILALGHVERSSGEIYTQAAWIQDTAAQGDADAQLALSIVQLLASRENDRNKESAVNTIRSLAAREHTFSQLILGIMYLVGEGVECSEQEGVAWVRKSAELGNSYAQLVMSACMYEGCAGFEKSEDDAKLWYQKSLESGNPIAHYLLNNPLAGEEDFFKQFSECTRKGREDYSVWYGVLDKTCYAFLISSNSKKNEKVELAKSPEEYSQSSTAPVQSFKDDSGASNLVNVAQRDFGHSSSSSSHSSYNPVPLKVKSIPAHSIKTVSNGSGPGYAPLERATLITPDGRVSSYTGTNIPAGMKPVVYHPGRVDNGTYWGKHVEYKPMTRKETAEHTIKNTNIVEALGSTAASGIEDLNEGRYAEGTVKTAVSVGVGLMILYALFSD